MAKQSGLHQIRGKVGEHSYYRQTGVNSGLIRAINQGLSSRVKTGDEYANTRLNNAEFGAACNVAGLLGRTVSPKYRPMVLPFSQSIMAKKVLELAKTHPGFWGQRVVTANDTPELAQILSDTSKLKVSDFMSVSLARTSAAVATLSYIVTESQASTLIGLGIDGINIKGTLYRVFTGEYSQSTGSILRGMVRLVNSNDSDEDLSVGSSVNSSFEITVGTTPAPTGFVDHELVTVLVQPYRLVNERQYVLQEYCMFVTLQLPAQNA